MHRTTVLSIVLLATTLGCESRRLYWKHDVDITNKANWESGTYATNCKGIHFSYWNTASIPIQSMQGSEIVLPFTGTLILLEDATIDLKETNQCIRLNPFKYYYWFDGDNWEIEGNSGNLAIPDKERYPCNYDDVILPHPNFIRIWSDFPKNFILVKSISYWDDLGYLGVQEVLEHYVLSGNIVMALDANCEDVQGCMCHRGWQPCPEYQPPKEVLPCEDPIQPENFCHEICGSSVTFEPFDNFRMENLQRTLRKYPGDTYASLVHTPENKTVIQVVFTEKDFIGQSLEDGWDFYKKNEGIATLELTQSGKFTGKSTIWGICFGTLLAVLAIFGVLFYTNGNVPGFKDIRVLRLGRSRNGTLFARFDNTDENLILEREDSTRNLPKAFENPIYGSSTSTSTIDSKSQHENPLYDVALKPELNEE